MTIARIGVVGPGSMASAVAQRLAAAGYDVTATDRPHDRAHAQRADVASGRLRWATLPADAAEDADVVVVCVRGERAAAEVLFDHGSIGETLRHGGLVLDTSATSPELSRAATERLAVLGLARVEGCLLGDPVLARTGQLRMLVGGAAADVATLGPVLSTLASSVVHTGGVGTATRLMALHRALLAGGYPATAQSLVREHSVRARRAA